MVLKSYLVHCRSLFENNWLELGSVVLQIKDLSFREAVIVVLINMLPGLDFLIKRRVDIR